MGWIMYSNKVWIKHEYGLKNAEHGHTGETKAMDEQHLPADDIQPHNEDRWWP